jgi:hypothetical protein
MFERTKRFEGTRSARGTESNIGSSKEGRPVSRALKSQKLWLALTYLGLILLMARTYA